MNWYTSQDAVSTTAMAQDFEKSCPKIKVEIQQAAALPLFTRFQQEQAAGVHTADVLSLAGYGLYQQAKSTDLIAPMDKSILTGFPSAFSDPDGYWFSNRVVTMMIVINTKSIGAADEPKSWADLTNAKYTGKIELTDPVQNGTGYILLWQLENTPGLGKTYLDSLAKQHPTLVATTGQAVQSLVSGEYGIGMIPDDAAWIQIVKGAPLKVIVPSDGVGTNPNYNMLVKSAPHAATANVFLRYLASKQGGQVSADNVGDYSAWPENVPAGGRPVLSSLKLLTNDGAKQATEQGTKSKDYFSVFSGTN